jgi:hypothetical protein
MRAFVSLFIAGLTLAGCSTVSSPGFTIPPITIPSFPINLESLDINLPTLAPGGNTAGACALVTEAEMSSRVGQPMTVQSNDGNECVWIAAQFTPSVIIRYDTQESIASGRLSTPNGRDLTIGGNPAYYGEFAGSLLYIKKGGRTLVVQAIWSFSGDEGVLKVSQIGELAASRF